MLRVRIECTCLDDIRGRAHRRGYGTGGKARREVAVNVVLKVACLEELGLEVIVAWHVA